MVTSCVVYKCDNTRVNCPEHTKFYRFPGRTWEKEQREKWVRFVSRKTPDGKDWVPNEHSRICSVHFVNNERSHDPQSPSFNPTIHPNKKQSAQKSEQSQRRFDRLSKRRPNSGVQNEDVDMTSLEIGSLPPLNKESQTKSTEKRESQFTVWIYETQDNNASTQVSHQIVQSVGMQTDVSNSNGNETIRSIYGFQGYDSVKNNVDSLRDLTTLCPTAFAILLSTFPATTRTTEEMSTENKLLLFLMKMKLGLTYQALGTLFNIHKTTASRIFLLVLNTLYKSTQELIYWPTRTAIQNTMPPVFKNKYPSTRVIIDCTEIKTEEPSKIDHRNFMFSHYKGTYTVKYLIGISPSGMITFISSGYGGRTTDAFITADCGILNLLESGDEILADKGFPIIKPDVMNKGGFLVTPPMARRDGMQFSDSENVETYNVAQVRVHVERAIQRVKNFNMLSNRVSIDLLDKIDRIFHVACVIVNLQRPIIKKK